MPAGVSRTASVNPGQTDPTIASNSQAGGQATGQAKPATIIATNDGRQKVSPDNRTSSVSCQLATRLAKHLTNPTGSIPETLNAFAQNISEKKSQVRLLNTGETDTLRTILNQHANDPEQLRVHMKNLGLRSLIFVSDNGEITTIFRPKSPGLFSSCKSRAALACFNLDASRKTDHGQPRDSSRALSSSDIGALMARIMQWNTSVMVAGLPPANPANPAGQLNPPTIQPSTSKQAQTQ